jgi:HlyD family secretion protein
MKVVRYIVIVAVLAGISAGGYSLVRRRMGTSEAEVPVTEVAKGEFRVIVREIGYLKAKRTVAVSTNTQGKVTKLLREGTFVEEGDPILWMETKEIEERIKELEVTVKVANANLDKTRKNNALQEQLALLSREQTTKDLAYNETLLEDAVEEYEKVKRLVEQGLYPEKDLVGAAARKRAAELQIEKARISLEKVEKELTTNRKIWVTEEQNAEAEYEKNQRELDKKNQDLEDAVLKAPTSGMVVYDSMWKGSGYEKLQEGDQVWDGQKVAEVPDMSTMLATVQINEMDSAAVKEGQTAEIRLVAVPDLLLKGEVTMKATLAEDKSQSRHFHGDRSSSAGLRTFDITVELEEVDPRLRQGMTANVTIVVDTIPDATYVPLDAVFDGESDGEKLIFVKDGDRFEKRLVETAAANDDYIMITSGVEPGEIITLKKPELAA